MRTSNKRSYKNRCTFLGQRGGSNQIICWRYRDIKPCKFHHLTHSTGPWFSLVTPSEEDRPRLPAWLPRELAEGETVVSLLPDTFTSFCFAGPLNIPFIFIFKKIVVK